MNRLHVLVGALVASAVLISAAGAANPGDPFLLGVNNSIDATTILSGNTASSAQLKVVNSNAATSVNGIVGLLSAATPTAASAAVRGENDATNDKGWGVYGSHAGSGTGVYGTVPDGTGVFGTTPTGIGVFGKHSAATGTDPGVQGETNSTAADAFGVLGIGAANTPTGNNAAVRGLNKSTSSLGYGVWGSQAGYGTGVYGSSNSGYGVRGVATSANPGAAGVVGSSSNGNGMYGYSGHYRGVEGETTDGIGVLGNSNTRGVVGTLGHTSCAGTYAVGGCGANIGGGVYGNSPSGRAVAGSSTTGYALFGSAAHGWGVKGETTDGIAVLGNSAGGRAVIGTLGGTSCAGAYAVGGCGTTLGDGVYGNSSNGKAIYGVTSAGYAGYFVGDVSVNGTLSKTAGSFRIDHPLDPAHKYLQHSFVESPDMMDVYNGNVTTDEKGFATVKMPRWFEALNRTFRYQLTVVGRSFAQAIVWQRMEHNRFTIRTNRPNVQVSWQVTGIRHDRYANAHRIKVEVKKPAAEQGRYLDPTLYGQPGSKTIGLETK